MSVNSLVTSLPDQLDIDKSNAQGVDKGSSLVLVQINQNCILENETQYINEEIKTPTKVVLTDNEPTMVSLVVNLNITDDAELKKDVQPTNSKNRRRRQTRKNVKDTKVKAEASKSKAEGTPIHRVANTCNISKVNDDLLKIQESYLNLVNNQLTPSSPYLQNILNHPLSNVLYATSKTAGQIQLNKKSPKKKPQKITVNEESEPSTFDPYWEESLVIDGLSKKSLVQGSIRINPKNYRDAYIKNPKNGEPDILIEGIKNRNRALEGDVVIVLLDTVPNTAHRKLTQDTGKVVYIKQKVHPRTCVGNLKLMPDKNREKALFVPRDHRVPRLYIPYPSWPDYFYAEHKKFAQTLFLARIVDWFDTRYALGTIVENMGTSGELKSETRSILAENGIDVTPFGSDVKSFYPNADFVIPPSEISLREDCRKKCIFTIDPSTARDLDDAVSCEILSNGNYEVGVHISDVGYFLKEGTLLDEKVAKKATTVYLVEKAYHMLPEDLCMMCSLLPGVDKLAFSIFWEITPEAVVLSHRYAKTVINSCCQLSYEHAQNMLINPDNPGISELPEIFGGWKTSDIFDTVTNLGKLSGIFRQNRFKDGALRIDQIKVSFHLNPSTGFPETFSVYQSKESHQLIEEFMLLANMTTAKIIYEQYPKLAFLRCHPAPNAYMLTELSKALAEVGMHINISSAGTIHSSMSSCVQKNAEDIGKSIVLNNLFAKPMTRAYYFCASDGKTEDEFWHYALNVPYYTHFTSPIRRYADIIVHRLLAATLDSKLMPNLIATEVTNIAEQCNIMKLAAKRAGEMSTELYTLKYICLNSPLRLQAIVCDVKDNSIDVIVLSLGLTRRVYLNKCQCKSKFVASQATDKMNSVEVVWPEDRDNCEETQVIKMFSMVDVELTKEDGPAKVNTVLIRPFSYKVSQPSF